jgi:hypothetical protein
MLLKSDKPILLASTRTVQIEHDLRLALRNIAAHEHNVTMLDECLALLRIYNVCIEYALQFILKFIIGNYDNFCLLDLNFIAETVLVHHLVFPDLVVEIISHLITSERLDEFFWNGLCQAIMVHIVKNDLKSSVLKQSFNRMLERCSVDAFIDYFHHFFHNFDEMMNVKHKSYWILVHTF